MDSRRRGATAPLTSDEHYVADNDRARRALTDSHTATQNDSPNKNVHTPPTSSAPVPFAPLPQPVSAPATPCAAIPFAATVRPPINRSVASLRTTQRDPNPPPQQMLHQQVRFPNSPPCAEMPQQRSPSGRSRDNTPRRWLPPGGRRDASTRATKCGNNSTQGSPSATSLPPPPAASSLLRLLPTSSRGLPHAPSSAAAREPNGRSS
mmetsp:Transcript_80167/g.240102  ORF Transcript_80167/g.240102 Transcript_80167/m.240102 type:complete len:207 (+) Transcript_80167:76-696(+)